MKRSEINRGGNVLIRVYNSLSDEEIDYESYVTVHTDGRTYTVPAGTQICLTPGRVSTSDSGFTTTFPWGWELARFCWGRSASATMTNPFTACCGH